MKYMKEKEFTNADILLLYPPTRGPLDYQHSIPCLAAYLKKHGFKVDVMDSPALGMTIKDICDYIKEGQPKIIGISIPFTPLAKTGIETIKALKKTLPTIPIICGGIHPTLVPEECVEYADFVCIGEGEVTLKEFIEKCLKGEDCKDIKGLAYKENGEVIINAKRDFVELDTLPMPLWDIVAVDKYRMYLPTGEEAMPIISSRGCPFSCNFCANWVLSDRKVRYRKVDAIIQEIKYDMDRYKIKAFDFRDENFTLNRKRATKICDALINAKLGIHWWGSTRGNLLDPEILAKMKEAGCLGVSIGVESGDEGVLEKIHKGVTLEEISNAIQMIKEAKLFSCALFIIGHPWDTPETVLKTIRFAGQLDVDFLGYAIATPYPKTELRRVAEEQGAILTNEWSEYHTFNVTYVPPGLKGYDLKKIQNIAIMNFYSQSFNHLYKLYKHSGINRLENIDKYNGIINFLATFRDLVLSYLRIKVTYKKYPENLEKAMIR